MVQLREIQEQEVQIGYRGELVAPATYTELLDLQVQIKHEQAEGWEVWFGGKCIPISPDGQVTEWPDGMLDHTDRLYSELFDF